MPATPSFNSNETHPIDSVVFATIAFAALPLDVRIQIIEGQYLVKIAMTVVSIPLVYWARHSQAAFSVNQLTA